MLDAVNFSRNCPNLPLSDPVGIWLLLFLWLVHSQQGKGWPHHPLRAEASHWQWNEFDGVYMPLETSFAVARGGEDATENWRRLFLTRIQFIHSWRLPNRWRCCREIGVVVSPFIKRSHSLFLNKRPFSRGKSCGYDKLNKYYCRELTTICIILLPIMIYFDCSFR